jgi:hypothetical protein
VTLHSAFAKKFKDKRAISRSSVITSGVVGGFVVLVIVGLVLGYLLVPGGGSTTTSAGSLSFSGIILISGQSSASSLNSTCMGDSSLEIYVTNTSPNTIAMTNVTIFASRLSTNATTLVPLSNGCLPVSENNPQIQAGANDLGILTYPNVPIPPYENWNVIINFSDGQNLTQLGLTSEPT